MPRILIVEDDEAIRRGLADKLRLEGYDVVAAADGLKGFRLASEQSFDLILLDLMLPGLEGRELCRRLRAKGNDTPIIMLTARADEVDKVVGLELGADDYVTKPFGIRELLARVHAQLRRARASKPREEAPALVRFGDIEADFEGSTVKKGGVEVRLTAQELKVLRLLYERRGRVVTRNQFLDEAWGYERFPTTRTVDFHILQLRKKLEDDPNAPRHIVTVHKLGYRLEL